MNCKEAAQLLSAAEERLLSRLERWALRLHLLVCSACRRFKQHLLLLRRVFSLAPAETKDLVMQQTAQLSPERSQRIKNLLREAAGGQ